MNYLALLLVILSLSGCANTQAIPQKTSSQTPQFILTPYAEREGMRTQDDVYAWLDGTLYYHIDKTRNGRGDMDKSLKDLQDECWLVTGGKCEITTDHAGVLHWRPVEGSQRAR